MISTLFALPYELARLPLVIVDNSLSDRLPETSGPRVTLDWVIGSADKVAGALLGNRDIARRGTDRFDRSDRLLSADLLEQEAATRREQARETAAAGRRQAAQQLHAAQMTVSSGLKEADAAEAHGKQEAKATKTASAKKAAATKRAVGRTATVKRATARVDAAAGTKKRAAPGAAKAKLNNARVTKQAAAKTRAAADRLGGVTKVKKQERKRS